MAARAPLARLLGTFTSLGAGRYGASIDASWMQGRTTYGGLSAALCLMGATRLLGAEVELPPLRSANVEFIGAVGGDSEVAASIVRRGRAMSFVRAELFSGGALATSATFAFGVPRESALDRCFVPTPHDGLRGPADCDSLFAGTSTPPTFTAHFDARLARGSGPASGAADADADSLVWVRHEGANAGGGVDGVADGVAMLAIADMLPPAMLSHLDTWRPVSSVTWHLNLLDAAPTAEEGGWWLLGSKAEHARHGYSSQDMVMWGARGAPVATGRQMVAIFA